MTRRFIGIRWWLGVAFAVVAAVSTALVVSQFSTRSQNAFRVKAAELANESTVVAARRVTDAERSGTLEQRIGRIAQQQNIELHVYETNGRLVASASPDSGRVTAPDLERDARRAVLGGGRGFRDSTPSGNVFVVGIPLLDARLGGLVGLSARPDVANAIGVVNDQALRAGVIAGVIGVLVGLVLAQLISLRLRRLSYAAEAMASGDFETPLLRYRFRDEFGALAQSFERMRRQLRRSFRHIEGERDRLRLLLERLHEGVVTVDDKLVVRFANTEARRLLGRLNEGDPLPDPWPSFSLPEFAERMFYPGAALAQAHVSPDAESGLAVVGIPAHEGETAMIVLDDLTEQERRELAEREFVSNAAHELRTPLTTIIGAVEVLQAGAKDDTAERDRFLAHIEREAARLARLARALLTLARAHAGQERPRLEPVELAPLLEEVADDLRPRDGVAIEIECPPALAASLNRDLLEQALRNLGENAAKHTSRGRVVLRAFAEGNGLRVEVEDTGVGMSAETQRHVFDRFYRGRDRDPEGFGLGLAIVRQAVRTLNGRVELDSAPGKGTRISLVLEHAVVHEEVPAA